MRKIENLINTCRGIIVISLFLLGSVTEVNIPVVATLCGLLVLSFVALIFFTEAKRRYKASMTLDKMKIPAQKKTSSAA